MGTSNRFICNIVRAFLKMKNSNLFDDPFWPFSCTLFSVVFFHCGCFFFLFSLSVPPGFFFFILFSGRFVTSGSMIPLSVPEIKGGPLSVTEEKKEKKDWSYVILELL